MNWDLNFWHTGEYQAISERIDDIRKSGLEISPLRKDMIRRPFKETPYDTVKVVLVGQDPYPNPEHATGLAFSVPPSLHPSRFPPTLVNILREYQTDLHYPDPPSGSLLPWAHRGVLLLNATPTCTAFKSLSHSEWSEWHVLWEEVFQRLDNKKVVYAFLGGKAKSLASLVHNPESVVHFYSHPSPRASLSARVPFLGSRPFSTINSSLVSIGLEPVNWRLDDEEEANPRDVPTRERILSD